MSISNHIIKTNIFSLLLSCGSSNDVLTSFSSAISTSINISRISSISNSRSSNISSGSKSSVSNSGSISSLDLAVIIQGFFFALSFIFY